MNKFTHISEYLALLIDDKKQIEKAAKIITGIMKARTPRLSDISREMNGKEDANYKSIQRFLKESDPKSTLLRLFQDSAKFVIGDPTEMPRPGAKKTDYVGKLSDGQTKGYWLLFLATPYQGRAILCHFVSYSSKTINDEATSRNRYHFQAFAQVKELLGERPLVLDREFSYLELMQVLVTEQINFVIRLKVGPNFFDQEGNPVALSVQKGEKRVLNKVFYMGKVYTNVIGWWQEGFSEPMWVMTNLPAEQGLEIYLQRMKIEESFRDLKSLLGLEKMMNKKRESMEKMVAWMLIAYAVSLIVGETLRNQVFPEQSRNENCFRDHLSSSSSNSICYHVSFRIRRLRLWNLSGQSFSLSDLLSELREI